MFDIVPEVFAQDSSAITESPLFSMVPFVLIFVVFYFLLIRPQQKKQKALQQQISLMEKGDKVVTSGGIHGIVYKLGDSTVTLEIAEKIRILVDRQQIVRFLEKNEKETKD